MDCFIADLHLLPGKQEEQNNQLIHFLADKSKSVKSLYILGDLFNLWFERYPEKYIGDYEDVFSIFRKHINDGMKVYLIPGNRDFAAGKVLREKSGINVLDDIVIIETSLGKTLLTHGDIFCTKGKKYVAARMFFFNKILRKVWSLLPWGMAESASVKIQNRQKNIIDAPPPEDWMDFTASSMKRIADKYHVDAIICGHVHSSRDCLLQTEQGREFRFISLSPWADKQVSLSV